MTDTLTPLGPAIATRPATRKSAPKAGRVGAFVYVAAWSMGLSAFGAGPGATASDARLSDFYETQRIGTATQSLLVHGVAALALLLTLGAARSAGRSTRVAHRAGLLAVGLSSVQCALGVYRSLAADGSTVAALARSIDRIDGAKMLALALTIGSTVAALRSSGKIGGTMTATGAVAALSLTVSGIAYGLGLEGLMLAAGPALVLLLAWVAATGIAADRAGV